MTTRTKWAKGIVIGLAVLMVAIEWIRLIPHARNDFVNHYINGYRILHGIFIYKGDVNRVYPPFWSLVHAPFTLVSDRVAMLLIYPFGVAAMAGLVIILKKLSGRHWPMTGDALFWTTAGAVFLASPFLQRDLGEVGVNTFLVMMTWLGIYCWTKRLEWRGGLCLGLAAAMKCTPVIFIGYFLWKRQWKMFLTSTIALLMFSVSPMILTGPKEFARDARYWFDGVKAGMSSKDPSIGVLGQEKVENLSLRPAMARYLMHLPYGHLGRPETSDTAGRFNAPEDRFYLQFLNLDPATANRIVRVVMFFGALGILWMLRRPVVDRRSTDILWECAALSLVILLYSPVTWRQHCVGVLPGLFFLVRVWSAEMKSRRWLSVILGMYFLLVCVLQREIFGQRLSKLFDAYRVKTLAIILLLIGVLACLHWFRRKEIA